MMKLSGFDQRKRATELLMDLRDMYKVLDVFGAMLQDKGDKELATRIFCAINTVNDCCGFVNDFVENFNISEKTVMTILGQNGRQEKLNDNQ